MTHAKLILSEFLPYQLSVTSNAVSDLIARSYRGKFGLSIPEWRVMAVLGEQSSMTQRALCTATAMDKVTINRASKTLYSRGLVARIPSETDGRSHHLTLTKIGRELYEQIVPQALLIEAEIEQILGENDAGILAEILERLRNRVKEISATI